jgi:formylglycine-generating enzyme required for sulfatase activity/serine/threonine protein kinase
MPPDAPQSLSAALENRVREAIGQEPETQRNTVESLCAANPSQASAIREVAGMLRRAAAAALVPPIPASIGPFRVLGQVGRGAFGTVYAAWQRNPDRKVAIKVLRPGLGSPEDVREVMTRFAAERQALALLKHPGIATVFDSGTTEGGQPYFVMEFVDGLRIVEYCEQHGLDLTARLLLFQQVCDAVQHAHQRGLIHRDLSINNVLVESHEGRPRAKVIDFGLVKSLTLKLTDDTLHSRREQVMGTPESMSPEQARSSGYDITTATDVYALGVMLYVLLTGTFPIPSARVRDVTRDELQRAIEEIEPELPSARVRASGGKPGSSQDEASAVALARRLARDLDWITMKAMAKARDERYGSAAELAAEIDRYLRDEPVQAGPPTAVYRVRKYVRRHRRPLLVAGSIIGALAIGLWAAVGARQQAQAHLDRYHLLADMVTLPQLEREAGDLWPETPENAAAMAEWLRRAREMGRHRSRVAAALDAVSDRARPLTPAEQEQARRQHPKAPDLLRQGEHLALLRQELKALRDKPERAEADRRRGAALTREEIPALEETSRALAAEIEAALVPRFAEPADQFLHDTLVRLREGLVRLETETIPAMEKRHAWATTVDRRTVAEERAAWDRAIASIASESECPLYRGYRLTPQTGLVPLSRDPQSGLWEFWHVRSGARPEPDERGRSVIGDETGIVLVLVPGGRFWMGAQKTDPHGRNHDPAAEADEAPVEEVELAPFFLARHELTQGQWERWTGNNPSYYRAGISAGGVALSLRHPVERVSWIEARNVLRQLGLCLPTEAQWEYACRAGTTTRYSTGDDVSSLRGAANVADEGSKRFQPAGWPCEQGFADGHAAHAPVGSFEPNPWGLFDLHGNVWEWCEDEWSWPRGQPARAGNGAVSRSQRGGSFGNVAEDARSASRNPDAPDDRDHDLGVRAARVVVRR